MNCHKCGRKIRWWHHIGYIRHPHNVNGDILYIAHPTHRKCIR